MTSFTVELLLGVILLGGAYILFGRTSSVSTAKAGNKKKKRSKASKKGQELEKSNVSNGVGTSTTNVTPAPSSVATKRANREQLPEAATKTQNNKKQGVSVTETEGTRSATDDDEEFPSLQASYARKTSTERNGSAPQKPLAERLAKQQPKTAVDDMVEKDDPIQGQKSFNRTMRIVKPEEQKPLLMDEDEEKDEWSNASKSSAQDSAWQNVPIGTKKASTIRLPASSYGSAIASQAEVRKVPGMSEPTKKQRQNARRAGDLKAAKELAEHERLQRLAAHKRAVENERMKEQTKSKGSKNAAPQVQSKRQDVGGGMQAVVHNGQLIWE